VEYTALEKIPHYNECSPLVSGLGYALVELRTTANHGQYQVRAVITHLDSAKAEGIGINDCAKVHRLLLPRLEALLKSQEVYMEVTSPGMERLIKNAAEFTLFAGKNLRVWDTSVSDWVPGIIISADSKALTLELSEQETAQETAAAAKRQRIIPFEQIAKAKLLHS
jgi:ribosome maturation factor RimP